MSAPAVPATKAAPTAQHQPPIALPGAAEIAARNNPLPKSSPEDAMKPETMDSAKDEKEKSIKAAEALKAEKGEEKKEEDKEAKEEITPATDKFKHEEHLSVPASALQSGTATPASESPESSDPEGTEHSKTENFKTTVSPQASSSPTTQAGSDVKDAPVKSAPVESAQNAEHVEETKKPEEPKKSPAFRESFIKESSSSSSSTSIASLAEKIQGMQVGDGVKVGEQEAGKAEDAVKSVED